MENPFLHAPPAPEHCKLIVPVGIDNPARLDRIITSVIDTPLFRHIHTFRHEDDPYFHVLFSLNRFEYCRNQWLRHLCNSFDVVGPPSVDALRQAYIAKFQAPRVTIIDWLRRAMYSECVALACLLTNSGETPLSHIVVNAQKDWKRDHPLHVGYYGFETPNPEHAVFVNIGTPHGEWRRHISRAETITYIDTEVMPDYPRLIAPRCSKLIVVNVQLSYYRNQSNSLDKLTLFDTPEDRRGLRHCSQSVLLVKTTITRNAWDMHPH